MVFTAVMASAVCSPAWAQYLVEVIVTADKRSKSAQDVPSGYGATPLSINSNGVDNVG